MNLPLLCVFCVTVTHSAVLIYPAKAGDQVILSLTSKVTKWQRTRNGLPEEHIKFCPSTENKLHCTTFVKTDETEATPATEAVVLANGSLVLKNVRASDAGFYFSHEEEQRVRSTSDGGISGTARTSIQLQVN